MMKYKFRKNLEIGKLDAETDSFLSQCFYESDVYKGIIDFDCSENNSDFTRRIIVGRTGSGKTALLEQIVSSHTVKVHDTITAENTVFEHINNNVFISELMEKGIDLRVFYKALWLHVLLVKVINQFYKRSNASFFDTIRGFLGAKKKSYNAELAYQYLDDFKDSFFNDNVVSEITDKMESELSGKVGTKGTNLSGKDKVAETRKIQTTTSSYVSKELLRKQKELIKLITEEFANDKQIKVIISIDDLDKSWLSTSSIRYDFINALLEAFKELLDIHTVKILIAIRTDIIMGIYKSSLRQDEKDQSLIYAISWNNIEIRKILDARINLLVKNQYQSAQEITFADIFNFKVNGEEADKYIIERTMLRPRDAINFVNLCLSQCNGEIELNGDMVIEAEEKFYSVRKTALAKEWGSLYPYITDYLDSLSFINVNTFNIKDLSADVKEIALNYLLERPSNQPENDDHTNRMLNFKELVKVWFTVGVIGIYKSSTLIIYSSFEKPELDITDLNKEFRIHPLFLRN